MSQYKLRDEQYMYHTGHPPQQSYDNQAYSGTQSYAGSQTYGKPSSQIYNEPTSHEDYRKKQKNKRCIIFGAVIFAVLLLAAAIAVGVYFGLRDDDKDEAEATAVTMQVTLTLDQPWDEKLNDPTSPEYQAKKTFVEDGMDTVFAGDSDYISTSATGFSPGSTKSDCNVKWKRRTIRDDTGAHVEITVSSAKRVINEKIQAKKGSNSFAAVVQTDKTQVELQTADVGKLDLGGECSNNIDCEDKHSECKGSPKKCTCRLNYYNKNANNNGGKCYQGKVYDETCTLDRECAYSFGACLSNKCLCMTGWYRHQGACKQKIDIDREGCTKNSHCKYLNATCEMIGNLGSCRCRGETYANTQGSSCSRKLEIGEPGCNNDNQCIFGKCLFGTCNCNVGLYPDREKKQCVSEGEQICNPKTFKRMMESDCSGAWNDYTKYGHRRQFELFVSCMWFQAFIRDQSCDLDQLLSDLRKSDMHTGLATMELATCRLRLPVPNGVEITFTTSIQEKVTLQMIVPNDIWGQNKYYAVGLSNDAFMPNSVIWTIENHPEQTVTNLRYAGSVRMRPEIQFSNIEAQIKRDHGVTWWQVDMEKTDQISGTSPTGDKYILHATGDIDSEEKEIKKHSYRNASSRYNLNCEKTDSQRLGELVPNGIQVKQDLCRSKWAVRYLVEHECFRVVPDLSPGKKCLTRLMAKYCVQMHFRNAGISCTMDDISATFNDEFVTWKLMENYPDQSTCESELNLSRCEKEYVKHGTEQLDCMTPLALAGTQSALGQNLDTETSADGSQLLKCSLWRGYFQCMSSHIKEWNCTASDLTRVTNMVAAVAQKYYLSALKISTLGSPWSVSFGDITVINYSQDCDVADLTLAPGTCPSDSLMADVIRSTCATNALFAQRLKNTIYPHLYMCSVDITECLHENVGGMLRLFQCNADLDTVVKGTLTKYSSWFNTKFGYDIKHCMDVKDCASMIEGVDGCTSFFGLFEVGYLLDDNAKCASAQLVANGLLPDGCLEPNAFPDKCKATDIWEYAVQITKQNSGQETGFEGCLDKAVNMCDALHVTILFQCYYYHHKEGDCSIINCIQTSSVPTGCTLDIEAVLSMAETIYGRRPNCDPDIAECIMQFERHSKCTRILGLVELGDKLNDSEMCAAWERIKEVAIPACMAENQFPDECIARKDDVIEAMLRAYAKEADKEDSVLFHCDGVQVDECAATHVTTLLECYQQYYEDGDCRIDECIKAATPPQGCNGPIDLGAVYKTAIDIYGAPPMCDCADGLWGAASATICSHAWGAWMTETNETLKCFAYQAFLGCIGFNYLVRGRSVCDFETIHNNTYADASKAGHHPALCGTVTDLFSDFPTTLGAICSSNIIYRSLLTFWCPSDYMVFPGTDAKSRCMDKWARKICLLNRLQSFCESDVIFATAESSAVSQGIFTAPNGCENEYPCVINTIIQAGSMSACFTGAIQFLFFVKMDPRLGDINAMNAVDSTDKLKCRVWDIVSGCSMVYVNTDCWTNTGVADIRSGLQILLSSYQAASDLEMASSAIFNGCPVNTPSNVCPVNSEVMYLTVSFCGFQAKQYMTQGIPKEHTCGFLLECARGAAEGYRSYCSTIDQYLGEVFDPVGLAYLKTVIGVTCSKPEKIGSCPSLSPGQVGTCQQECNNDYYCKSEQKCCSNGCGHTCQDPVNA